MVVSLIFIIIVLFVCLCSMHFNLQKAAEVRADDLIQLAKQDNELIELRHNMAEHQRLHSELNQLLHPHGDAPKAPSLCDLVSYVRIDVQAAYRNGFLDACKGLAEQVDEATGRKLADGKVASAIDHNAVLLNQVAHHRSIEYVKGNLKPVPGL